MLQLLKHLDEVGHELARPIHVLLVDDGSEEPPPERLPVILSSISRVEILRLRRNVGHQRAITLGLAYLSENCSSTLVVVMDADGEDSPNDVKLLIGRCEELGYSKIVFAKRRKRTEGIVFRAGYGLYKALHYLLTGRGISIGNFSVIPAGLLPKVVGISELWNHYAAGIVHARMPLDVIPIARAQRLAGKSKMNFVSLVTHGMSAISVYGDVVGVRLLCLTSFLTAVVLAGLASVLFVRLFTDLAILGWATNAFGILAVALLNLLVLSAIFVLFLLHARNMAGFIPVRDWKIYVASQRTVFER